MTYLGEIIEVKNSKIHDCKTYSWNRGMANTYMLETMKAYIRQEILSTYQPTKTLKWLEEQTGVKWLYNNEYEMLSVDCFFRR